jgi:predicted amidophosphoribosyltransferase
MEYFFQYLRSCSNCGGSFVRSEKLLCKKCFELCEREISTTSFYRSNGIGGVRGYSLWDWVPGKSDALSSLLLSLKGGRQKQAFKYYAQRLLHKRISLAPPPKGKTVFIPAPSTKSVQTIKSTKKTGAQKQFFKDHARSLAESLVELTGEDFLDAFQKQSIGHQRDLGRSQRLKIGLGFNENFSKEEILRMAKDKKVVFVDDVVTTGATAIAAKELLLNFKSFEVWALAQREPCTPRATLL